MKDPFLMLFSSPFGRHFEGLFCDAHHDVLYILTLIFSKLLACWYVLLNNYTMQSKKTIFMVKENHTQTSIEHDDLCINYLL